MEDSLIQDIALWGIIAIASVLVALMLFAVMTVLKRKIPVQNPEQKTADIKLGKAIIQKIDSLDELIASRLKDGEDEALLRQLKHFRNDLLRLLQNHSIEAYALEKGTALDASARKLIDIVDSDGSTAQESARIVEVVRLGYRYQKNLSSPSTIVRKPAVRVR